MIQIILLSDTIHSFEIIDILTFRCPSYLNQPFGSDLFLIAKYPEHLEI